MPRAVPHAWCFVASKISLPGNLLRSSKNVYEITARSPAKQDADFCRDVRRSAASAPRNMAEGFGRFWPTEFAPKMRIAKGELEETQDHVRKATRQRYVTESEGDAMITSEARDWSVDQVRPVPRAEWRRLEAALSASNAERSRKPRTRHVEPGNREPGTGNLLSEPHLYFVADDSRFVASHAHPRILNQTRRTGEPGTR